MVGRHLVEGGLEVGEAGDERALLLHPGAVEPLHQLAQLLRAAAREVLGADLVEGGAEGVAVGEAAVRGLVERGGQRQPERLRDLLPAPGNEAAHADDLPYLVAVHVAVETVAGQHLVEGHGGGELITPAVDVVTAGLLR